MLALTQNHTTACPTDKRTGTPWIKKTAATTALTVGLALGATTLAPAASAAPVISASNASYSMGFAPASPLAASELSPAASKSVAGFSTKGQHTLAKGPVRTAWWNILGDYSTCILGIGVPVAVMAYFVKYLWSFERLMAVAKGATPAPGGAAGVVAQGYARSVWNACGRFIRS